MPNKHCNKGIKFIIVLLAFLLAGLFANGQQTSKKVLIIDTLQGALNNFEIAVWRMKYGEDRFKTIHTTIRLNRWPNLAVVLSADTIDAWVNIPLDDSGGNLEIKNFFRSKSDTIRISKYEVFRNCFADTFFTSIGWFFSTPTDSGTEKLKHLSWKRRILSINKKKCNIRYPKELKLTLNQETYVVPIMQKQVVIGSSIYHGFRHRREEEKKFNGKPYKYFVGSDYEIRPCLLGIISIP